MRRARPLRWLTPLLVLLLVGSGAVGQEIPQAGLQAEMEQRWDDAAEIYEDQLRATPDRADLWLRLGDIHAARSDAPAAAAAFAEAARLQPDVAAVQAKASQAHAVAKQWREALAAIRRAVELEPENADYLRAQAQLAHANRDTALARDSFAQLVALDPEDERARLGLLQARTWLGELDPAGDGYEVFLTDYPLHERALLDAARVELWRGNYARAIDRLDAYDVQYGVTEDSRRLRARVLARANRADAAFAELEPLQAEHPHDFDLAYTETVAFVNGRYPSESVAALEYMEQEWPDRPELPDMRRYVMTRLRSNATVEGDYYEDSDDIRIWRAGAWGEYALSPDSFLAAGGEHQWLTADRGSGLEHRDGGENAEYWETWVGGRHRHSPEWAGDVRVGVGESEDKAEFIYRIGVQHDPRDDLRFELRQDRMFHLVSPRAVSHHVHLDRTRLRGTWDVDLRHTIDFETSYSAFSDGNDRYLVGIAPRRQILRRAHYNLDVGVSALWYRFDDDEDHGYYDPGRFQRYMLTTFHYWKINDDDGVSLAVAVGASEDDLRDQFDFASDAVVRGVFGLYRDWQLVVYGSVAMNEQSLRGVDDYTAGRVGFALTRRF